MAVDVHDVAAAQRWYKEKMGLGYFSTDLDEEEGSMKLGYSAEEAFVYLLKVSNGKRPDVMPGHPPIIFARKLDAAIAFLSSHGVDVGPLQHDSAGNHFIRFHDLEGNELEVCQQT